MFEIRERKTIVFFSLTVIFISAFQLQSGQAKLSPTDKYANAGGNKLEALLDWDTYKQLFNKRYSSMRQQLARQKIFLSSAMDVFKRSVKYMAYMTSSYTSINKYSDYTQDEIDRIISGDKSEPRNSYDKDSKFTDDSVATDVFLAAMQDDLLTSSNVDYYLLKTRSYIIERKSKEIELKSKRKHINKTRGLNRKKRSFSERRRDFSPDDLIRLEKKRDSLDGKNFQLIIPSNNPDYEVKLLQKPYGPLMGASSNQVRIAEDIPPDRLEKALHKLNGLFDTSLFLVKASLQKMISEVDEQLKLSSSKEEDGDNNNNNNNNNTSDDDEKDLISVRERKGIRKKSYVNEKTIIIRDWTDSGCIGPVRNQEVCNSCYAISSIGYMEWSLCMNQNHILTPLSAQYVVDCGIQYSRETQGQLKLNGCTHGSSKQAIDFIREYGLELEANMEYFDYETKCPVPFMTPKKKKGYIRPNVGTPVRLNSKTKRLDLALEIGPVIVSMKVPKDFTDYAGGILDYCNSNDSGHSMLVVGNAIEDGIEYLLIKNSFGTGWGYDGYLKFKRSAVADCVKEFISPVISFPSDKSKERRIKAYLASKESGGENSNSSESDEVVELNENQISLLEGQRLFTEYLEEH